MFMTAGMWSDAMKAKEPDLVCPCGEQNSPNDATNQIRIIDSRGNVACSTCGLGGPLQMFQRPQGDPHAASR